MNVYLTFDYELFFGTNSGSAQNSIIKPTNLLLKKCENFNAKFTFFIDVGYLMSLEKNKEKFNELDNDLLLIKNNIKSLIEKGHSCQLHIHPHWEESYFDGKNWNFNYEFYKLSDFTEKRVIDIFSKYKLYLEKLTNKKVHSFRAGGWCIQPFSIFKKCFELNKIVIDSSVFKGGKHCNGTYNYNFLDCVSKDYWCFSDDPCKENNEGNFVELAITSNKYSLFFFWRLFILGRLFPKYYKNIGDGTPMASDVTKKKYLTKSHLLSASVDGYFASKSQKIINRNIKNKIENTVFLGHPKALSIYSIDKIYKLIRENKNFNFESFDDFYNRYLR